MEAECIDDMIDNSDVLISRRPGNIETKGNLVLQRENVLMPPGFRRDNDKSEVDLHEGQGPEDEENRTMTVPC